MGYLDKLKAAASLAQAAMEESAVMTKASDPTSHLALHGKAGMVSYGYGKTPEGPDRIEDPGQWEYVRRTDHAARDARRADYLSPSRAPYRITRVVTRGKDQERDVAGHLGATGLAARPDLMYGLYRVPDRISPSAGNEAGNVVEWDFVHAANEALPSSAAPTDVFFDAERAWVSRRPGEPRVLDEDLALAYLVRAGLGPEQTLGIARHVDINLEFMGSGENNEYMRARVAGIHVFHPEGMGIAGTRELDSGEQFEVPLAAPPAGIWLEVLQWEPIARVIHPLRQHRPRLPSPFPHLPLTPQELLQAYVEIVGIAPWDSYGVQVTYHRPFDLLARTSTAKHVTVRKTTGGDQVPCADGTYRPRLHGGQHVVVAYRDGPAYAEGRVRWAAYEKEVLESTLAQGLAELRSPVPKPDSRFVRTFNRVGKVMDFVSGEMDAEETFVAPRYCWPPTA